MDNYFTNLEYPAVIIGDAVTDFKRSFTGPINSVKDIVELKDLIAYYSGIRYLDRVLVIEDISFIGEESNTALLKFIEESTFSIVLLSRYDRLNNIILSRIRSVIKYYKEGTDSKFLKCSEGLDRIEEALSADSHYFDKVRYMGKLAPKLILLEKTMKVRRVKNKIMQFVD